MGIGDESQLQIRIRHRSERGSRDVGGVFGQHAARVSSIQKGATSP
jgi:hypothetical protein